MDNIRLNNDLVAIPDLRNQLRKLRWFVSAFKVHASLVEQETAIQFSIDEGKLNRVFFNWIDSLGSNRQGVDVDLRDFVAFAAGLALRSLIRHNPVTVLNFTATVTPAENGVAQQPKPTYEVWPEGFLCVNFCLSVIAALEEQEFGNVISRIHDDANNSLFWGSFWENVTSDSRLAVPYLDRLLGKEPNWEDPLTVLQRPAMRHALSDQFASNVANNSNHTTNR